MLGVCALPCWVCARYHAGGVCVNMHILHGQLLVQPAMHGHPAYLKTGLRSTKQARVVTYTHMLQASIARLVAEAVTVSRLPIPCTSCVSQECNLPMSGTKHRCRIAQTPFEALQRKQAAPVYMQCRASHIVVNLFTCYPEPHLGQVLGKAAAQRLLPACSASTQSSAHSSAAPGHLLLECCLQQPQGT